MNYALSASTRSQLDLYMAHQASLNGLPVNGLQQYITEQCTKRKADHGKN
ncbi:TPA: hypothetical protein ACTDYK_001684 [Salmonella enterica subsp. enterica serovar Newport]